jgi:hypothetical protein
VEGKEVGSMSATTEDEDEIDWDKIQNNLDNNLEVDILSVKKSKDSTAPHRSLRNKGAKCTSRKKRKRPRRKAMNLQVHSLLLLF